MQEPVMVKNMVCQRCIDAVKGIFARHGIPVADVTLGSVMPVSEIPEDALEKLKAALNTRGFELLDDRNTQIINRIKTLIIDNVHHARESPSGNLSTLLSEKLHYD